MSVMKAVDTLREEHDAVLVVLSRLKQAAQAAAEGQKVPAGVFMDIGEFLSVFVDRCHHAKEETVIFPLLREQGESSLVNRLAADHETGRQRAAELARAIENYIPGNAETGQRLAQAVDAYSTLLQQHIQDETELLFPAMMRLRRETDLQIVQACDRIEVEEIGEGTHERFHAMIDSLPDRLEGVQRG